ncbi:MAG: hypothetical protein ACOYOV_02860 [Bacteroidales bacterium]
MAAKHSDIIKFFTILAIIHSKINHKPDDRHFFQIELNDFLNGSFKVKGYNMIFEVMPIKFEGVDFDHPWKIREVAFIIIKSLEKVEKAFISEAFDECEEIMDDILSAINKHKAGNLTPNFTFDINSIEAHQVTDGKNFGIRCLIDIKSIYNFNVIPEHWNIYDYSD